MSAGTRTDRRIWPHDSIRARLLGFSILLITVALVAGYLAITGILDRFITGRFDAEVEAVADTLIAGAALDASGRLIAQSQPSDARFDIPLSGWFWQLMQGEQAVAKSASLFDNVLRAPAGTFTGGHGSDPNGAALRVARYEFTLPDSSQPLAVVVSAPQSEITAAAGLVRMPLVISLLVLGVGLGIASILQVMAGLSSLDRLGRDLRAIRDGRADTLPLPSVAELRPVAQEINGLLSQNRQLLSRAREHLGNLAHSLKTPLTALGNDLPAGHGGQVIIERMDRQISWHLRRARSAGVPNLLGHRTLVAPVINDIHLVLRGQLTARDITVEIDCPAALSFAGERQDLEEMIGNLFENAAKWASRDIKITAHELADKALLIQIDDDGPGMCESGYALALSRGGRLDETGPPGTGLGLAITADIARFQSGKLTLAKSSMGGLRATLSLPA